MPPAPTKKVTVVHTSQTRLNKIVTANGAVRAGATIDPQQRASSYASTGYRGTMYVAKTQNMKYAENRLFHTTTSKQGSIPRHNQQSSSNVSKSSGFTYVIKGKKYK